MTAECVRYRNRENEHRRPIMNPGDHVVLGADFGTDSVRVLALDPANGEVLGQGVRLYPRWKKGLYCDPLKNQFRQHP